MYLRQLSLLRRTMPFYAVAKGRQVGIFATWPECQSQVNGFTAARFKKFNTQAEAQNFIDQNSGGGGSGGGGGSSNGGGGMPFAANYKPPAKWTMKRSVSTSATTETNPPATKQSKKTILLDAPPTPVSKMVKYGEYSFLQDDDGFVHAYTDGSCEGNGTAKAAAGLGVYFAEGHALNTSKPVSGRATNNCGEIQAASLAIRLARQQGVRRLVINTDSQFLINAITKWLPGWKRRKWTLANGTPVKNKTDFVELEGEMGAGDMVIKWNHVDAHCGILGNERADQLARKGSEMFRQQRLPNGVHR